MAKNNDTAHTILFWSKTPTDDLNRLNRQSISVALEALVPNEITDEKINTCKNIFAVVVKGRAVLDILRTAKCWAR